MFLFAALAMGEGGGPSMLERVVERTERLGFVMDMNRHPCVFLAYHELFTEAMEQARSEGDKSAFSQVQVDMLKIQDRRRTQNQRSDRGALPTLFDYRTLPFDVYIFQGMSQTPLVLYRTRSRRVGIQMMARALENAAPRITHSLHVPEILFFTARQMGHALCDVFPHMKSPPEHVQYTPYTAPHGTEAARGRWLCDVVVPHRYRHYVPTSYAECSEDVQVQELERLAEFIRQHTDPIDSLNDVMPAAPHTIVSAAIPRRESNATELEQRMNFRRAHSRLIGQLMMYGFGDHSFLLHLEAATLAKTRVERNDNDSSSSTLTPEALAELDRAYEREKKRQDSEYCSRYSLVEPDEDDAHSQQFYNDISRYVSENSFMDAMVENRGHISYRLLNGSRGNVERTHISSLQLAAAVYAVLVHASKQLQDLPGTCDQCAGEPERIYVTVRAALNEGHKRSTAILWCWRNRDHCTLCGTSVILISLVYQAVVYANRHGRAPDYAYLRRCNHMCLPIAGGNFDVARYFCEALEFFCRIDEAIEFQRHPWRFSNFSYFPVEREDDSGIFDLEAASWEDADNLEEREEMRTAVHFEHTPVLVADGSLYTTRRVVDILYETSPMGHVEREKRTLSLAASANGARVPFGSQEIRMTPRQCDMIQACFNHPMGAYRAHVTNATHHDLYVATCQRDRDCRVIPLPHTPEDSKRYATPEDVLECKEERDFFDIAGVLHKMGRDHVHAWPLVLRNFLYGEDPELFWSILWIKKHVARHKGHTILADAKGLGPSYMLTPGDPLFREMYSLLPALLEKTVGVEEIFDELMEPFRAAITDPENCGLDQSGRVAYSVNLADRHRETGANNLYSALMTFINAKEPQLAIDSEVFVELAKLFRENDQLAAEKERAAQLFAFISLAMVKCARSGPSGDVVVLINGANETNSDRSTARKLADICGPWPIHFVLYDAVLSHHVPREMARAVFLGVARNRRNRTVFVLPAFIHSKRYDAKCTSIDTSFALSREAYAEHLRHDSTARPTPTYNILKELCSTMEVLARFRHTASSEEARRRQLVYHLESDGGQVFRGLLAERFIREMASVGPEPAVFDLVSDASRALLSCRVELGSWRMPNDPLGARTTRRMFPAWKPFLGPVYLDRTLLTMGNVVYGVGELSPFTGSTTHFLECVAWHPITHVHLHARGSNKEWEEFMRHVSRPVDNQILHAVRDFRRSCDSIMAYEDEDEDEDMQTELSISPSYKRPRSPTEDGSAPIGKVVKRRLDDLRERNGVTDAMIRPLNGTRSDPILTQMLFARTFPPLEE